MSRPALYTLDLIHGYDTFLEGIKRVCDMGCGTGEDAHWWATLETQDEAPEPYNFTVYAVDRDANQLSQLPDLPNLKKICKDFTEPNILPSEVDFLWCHDSFQYATNPLQTLRQWNEMMNVNGMMILSVKQHAGIEFNRYSNRTHSGCFYHYSPTNLIYMLAVNGFDCADAYLLKRFNDPWIRIAVYKSPVKPMDPTRTSWHDLLETGLLHWSVANSIKKHGFLAQEEIVYSWLDKENYFVDWIPMRTEIPPELANVDVKVEGVFNKTVKSDQRTVEQGGTRVKQTELLKPINILRPPKGRYVK